MGKLEASRVNKDSRTNQFIADTFFCRKKQLRRRSSRKTTNTLEIWRSAYEAKKTNQSKLLLTKKLDCNALRNQILEKNWPALQFYGLFWRQLRNAKARIPRKAWIRGWTPTTTFIAEQAHISFISLNRKSPAEAYSTKTRRPFLQARCQAIFNNKPMALTTKALRPRDVTFFT